MLHSGASVLDYGAFVLILIIVYLISAILRNKRAFTLPLKFVPFSQKHALAVDCHREESPCLTHHRGSTTPSSLRADTSTEIVLKAVAQRHLILRAGEGGVTCNHFDGDGLTSVFAAVYPEEALRIRSLLIACAKMSDFREHDDLSLPQARAAIAWSVWINSIETALFWRPFAKQEAGSESAECVAKFAYFIPRCKEALDEAAFVGELDLQKAASPESYTVLRSDAPAEFDAELTKVYEECAWLAAHPDSIHRCPSLGLAIVNAPWPMHYYALFGRTAGLDTVMTIMPGGRYEVECKYTGYVQLASRDVLPRLSLVRLAAALTDVERHCRGSSIQDEWVADRFIDSGPLLRLQRASGARLSRAQRFGHPYERDIATSCIPAETFINVVVSYLEHGYKSVAAKPRPTWTWADLHSFNKSIDWREWSTKILSEHVKS